MNSMNATAKAIAAVLLEDVPHVYCYPCLAAKVRVIEKHHIRGAAQHLVLRADFQIRRLRCAACGAEGDFLRTPYPDLRAP